MTGELSGFDDTTSEDSEGWYAVGQQDLWSNEQQALTAVVQCGGADDNRCDYARHLAVGLWAQGVIPGRADDGLGLYVSDVRFTDATDSSDERQFPARHETTVEGVYALALTGWWLLRADAQYIRHPGGSRDPQSAVVVALRSDINL